MVAQSRADRQEARDLNKSRAERCDKKLHAERCDKKLHAVTKRLRAEVAECKSHNRRIMGLLVASRITSQDYQDDLETTRGERVGEQGRAQARINRAVEWGTTWRDLYDRRRNAYNQLLIHFNALEAREYIHTHYQSFAAVADPDRLDADSWLREDIPDPRLWGRPGSAVPLFYGFPNE